MACKNCKHYETSLLLTNKKGFCSRIGLMDDGNGKCIQLYTIEGIQPAIASNQPGAAKIVVYENFKCIHYDRITPEDVQTPGTESTP